MNPLDELYEYAKDRKVITGSYVVEMIERYKHHQTNENGVLRGSSDKLVLREGKAYTRP